LSFERQGGTGDLRTAYKSPERQAGHDLPGSFPQGLYPYTGNNYMASAINLKVN
jgi:hypothetical protein